MADFGLGDLLSVGGSIWDYYNKKGTLQDMSKNYSNAISGAADKIVQYQEPYRQAGLDALPKYTGMGDFSFSPSDLTTDPSYQWRLNQGLENTQRTAAAKGAFGGGSTLVDLTNYSQNAASQEYQAAFDRALQTRKQNQSYYGGLVDMGAKTAQNMGTNLGDLQLTNAGYQNAISADKAQIFNQALGDMGIFGDSAAASQLLGVADKISEQMFGTSLSDLTQPAFDSVMKTIKQGGADLLKSIGGEDLAKSLGLGGAGAIGSADLLGQGIYGSSFGTMTDLGGGMFFDSASGAIIDAGQNLGAQGAQAAGASLSDAAAFLSSAPGMGLTAAALTLISGGDVKDAAVTGGLTYAGAYIGSMIFPGVGTMIGGVLGGLASSFLPMGGYAKADSALTTIQVGEGFDGTGYKDKVYAEGPWGGIGFKGSSTRHLDVGKGYQETFNYAAGIDQLVSGMLTEEENAKVKSYLADNPVYGKDKNEGGISPKTTLLRIINNRNEQLKKALGTERYNALDLENFYMGLRTSIKSGGKK